MSRIVELTLDNIDKEHICCALSDKKEDYCVSSKKAWLRERLREGLVFAKLDVRGKVFIEYLPAAKAWSPILANNYMYINCFWVSGQYKGQGYANMLLDYCIKDAINKEKDGLVILSSHTKIPFLSDPNYLKYKGFKLADEAYPYYELLYLPFRTDSIVPKFKECAKSGAIVSKEWTLYYSNQCPHTSKYVSLIADFAHRHDIVIDINKVESLEHAQNAPMPYTTYSLFYNGKFITNEILSEKSFERLLRRHEILF